MEGEAATAALPNCVFHNGEAVLLSFRDYRTGNLEFTVVGEGKSVDAPLRLHFTFGEVPGDLDEDLCPYRGELRSSSMAVETGTAGLLPQAVPRTERFCELPQHPTVPAWG